MANNYLGKNFGQFSDAANADGIPTKYLNLQGLTDFWSKIKTYVDDQDDALFEAAKTKIKNVDSTLRSYIETLTINGQQIISDKAEGKLGVNLTVEIGGEDIKVNHNGTAAAEDEKYAGKKGENKYTVREAFADVDTRLDAMERAIGENIVNSISVTDTPNTEGTPNYVSFTMNPTGDPKKGTYNVALDVDETKLDTKIAAINEQITELEANAGVAGIRVVDTDSTEVGEKHTGLVEISLEAVKVNDKSDVITTVGDVEYHKSLVTLTLDETKLAQDLNEIDTTIATEVADRKEDVANLAGNGYTVADGATAGAWNTGVKYNNITAISERIAQIDKNLVTTINVVDTDAVVKGPNWVEFTKADTAASGGDNSVTLTVNESKLGEYIAKNETNLSALGGLTINDHEVIKVTAGSGNYAQVTVGHADVVLSTADITRNTTKGAAGTKNLEEQLTEYDNKLAALASATHFRGKYNTLEEAAAAVLEQGDIVIVGLKEYIYYDASVQVDKDFPADYTPSTANFIELGDIDEEQTRIEALEDWIDTNIIQEAEITAIFTANGTKPTFTF